MVSYLAEYGPGGRWFYVSPQIEHLLGFSADEWIADRELWWKRVHPEDRDRLEAEEQRCVETLEPLSIEYRMFDPRRARRLGPRRGRLRAPRGSAGCWSRA